MHKYKYTRYKRCINTVTLGSLAMDIYSRLARADVVAHAREGAHAQGRPHLHEVEDGHGAAEAAAAPDLTEAQTPRGALRVRRRRTKSAKDLQQVQAS